MASELSLNSSETTGLSTEFSTTTDDYQNDSKHDIIKQLVATHLTFADPRYYNLKSRTITLIERSHMLDSLKSLVGNSSDPIPSLDYATWVLETGLWDGRAITWKDAGAFQKQLERKLAILLAEADFDSYPYQKLIVWLATAGVEPQYREFLVRELQALGLSPNGAFIQAGLLKKLINFIKEHKTEIIVGVAVVAVITTVVIVAACSAGTAGGAAAALGGAAIDGLNHTLDNQTAQTPPSPAGDAPVEGSAIAGPTEIPPPPDIQNQVPEIPPPLDLTKSVYLENGVLINGEFLSYTDILTRANLAQALEPIKNDPASSDILITESPSPIRDASFTRRFFETIGRGIIAELSPDPELRPQLPQETSRTFLTPGTRHSHLRIGGIPGMDNSFSDSLSHANYIKSFTPDLSIEWVHNHSNSPPVDVAEILFLNFLGFSPNTANLLQKNWTAFHEENKDRPNAKYLHFCHSQGGFQTKNALENCSKEVQNRIIVVNIGVATRIPKEICFKAYNYASKTDLARLAELGILGALDPNDVGISKHFEMILEQRQDIILLTPHPDQIGMGHGFEDPTFGERIKYWINDYLQHNGEYR